MLLCPLCKSRQTRLRWPGLRDRLFRTTDEHFDLWRCDACSAHFLDPMPSLAKLAGYYPDDYWVGPRNRRPGRLSQHGLLEIYRRLTLRDHVQFARTVLEGQRARDQRVQVLDVGCGDGSFLEALGEPDCIGLDLSLPALRAVRARGIRAVRGMPSASPLRPGTFSLVTAFHFLEHVYPIEPVVAALRALLAPGGELVVQVPNSESWQAKLLGRYWSGYDVPRHLIDYDEQSLCRTLERCGFSVVTTNHHCVRDNPTTIANSLIPSCYPPARLSREGGTSGIGGTLAVGWAIVIARTPTDSSVVTSAVPPYDTSGSGMPVSGARPSTAARLIAASPEMSTVMPAARRLPNGSLQARAMRKPA